MPVDTTILHCTIRYRGVRFKDQKCASALSCTRRIENVNPNRHSCPDLNLYAHPIGDPLRPIAMAKPIWKFKTAEGGQSPTQCYYVRIHKESRQVDQSVGR